MAEIYPPGARVRLKATTAPNWVDPKMRRAAETGRPGKVLGGRHVGVVGPLSDYCVIFDTKVAFDNRLRATPILIEWVPASFLEPVNGGALL